MRTILKATLLMICLAAQVEAQSILVGATGGATSAAQQSSYPASFDRRHGMTAGLAAFGYGAARLRQPAPDSRRSRSTCRSRLADGSWTSAVDHRGAPDARLRHFRLWKLLPSSQRRHLIPDRCVATRSLDIESK